MPAHPFLALIVNQAAWFACVCGAAKGHFLIGPAVVAALAAVHLATRKRRGEAAVLVAAALLGSAVDLLLARSGLVVFQGGLMPLWMTALWVNFALLASGLLSWLHRRLWLAALLGAVGGPIAYLSGQRLGALEFTQGALLAVALQFGVIIPLLLRLARPREQRS